MQHEQKEYWRFVSELDAARSTLYTLEHHCAKALVDGNHELFDGTIDAVVIWKMKVEELTFYANRAFRILRALPPPPPMAGHPEFIGPPLPYDWADLRFIGPRLRFRKTSTYQEGITTNHDFMFGEVRIKALAYRRKRTCGLRVRKGGTIWAVELENEGTIQTLSTGHLHASLACIAARRIAADIDDQNYMIETGKIKAIKPDGRKYAAHFRPSRESGPKATPMRTSSNSWNQIERYRMKGFNRLHFAKE